jgi:hypothetical protein
MFQKVFPDVELWITIHYVCACGIPEPLNFWEASLSKLCTMREIYPLMEFLAHEILDQLGLVSWEP